MKRLLVEGRSGRSLIAIGDSLARLQSYCDATRVVIITDPTVRSLHGFRFPPWTVIEIGIGEGAKTLKTAEAVYEAFLSHGVDRASMVVAVGGGIVCDVAGFAASTYLRGLPFGFVPTTLLAQVDASVGGKNGVNLHGYKNLVGTFAQPAIVLCDPDLLRTLPATEVRNGFAEVIKQAAIGDGALFSFLETAREKALSLDPAAIDRIVYDCLRVKTAIVSQDELERGQRRKLNFGHTLGHAVEKVHGLRHGEAVSIGMTAAARLSVKKGLLALDEAARLEALLRAFGLPVSIDLDRDLVCDALKKDKKRAGDAILFVLLDNIGSARVVPIGIDEIEGVIDDLRQPR
jgi:3-dehydroquinate synthase